MFAKPAEITRESGFTLVELLLAATLMGVVLAASLTALASLERTNRDAGDRASTVTGGRAAMERLTRELRQASKVHASPVPGGTTFVVSTYVHPGGQAAATVRDVTYSCAASTRSCTRTVAGTGGGTTVIRTGHTNSDVFAFSAMAPSTVVNRIDIKLVLGLEDGKTVELRDGVDLRNAVLS